MTPPRDRLFVTGKNWPQLYEIDLVPRRAPRNDRGRRARSGLAADEPRRGRCAADRARRALRDGRGRHPRRADAGVEERAALAADAGALLARATASGCSRSTRTSGSASRPRSAPSPRSPPSCSGAASARATGSRSRWATCPNGRSPSSRSPRSARSRCRSTPGGPARELEYGLADSGAKAADLRRARAWQRIAPHLRRAARRSSTSSSAAPSEPRRRATGSRMLIGAPDELGAACPTPTCPTSTIDARRRGDDLLHQRHHRPAQGRARHAPQLHHQHPVERLCRSARAALRRGEAPPEPTPQDRPDGHPAVPRHRAAARA